MENGVKIGEITFDPTSRKERRKIMSVYAKLAHLSDKLTRLQEIDHTAIAKDLDSTKDFKATCEAFDQYVGAFDALETTTREVVPEVDGIFGDGTCEIFLQGTDDIEMLLPFLESAMALYEEPNAEYMSNKEQGVMR